MILICIPSFLPYPLLEEFQSRFPRKRTTKRLDCNSRGVGRAINHPNVRRPVPEARFPSGENRRDSEIIIAHA